MEVLMDTCHDVKNHLNAASFEVFYYEDGSYAEFKVNKIITPKALNRIIGNLDYRITSQDGYVVISIFEDSYE